MPLVFTKEDFLVFVDFFQSGHYGVPLCACTYIRALLWLVGCLLVAIYKFVRKNFIRFQKFKTQNVLQG